MPRYRNTLPRPLRVEIGDVAHLLPEGGVVEIPERFVYLVAARGLKLAPTDEPANARAESLAPPPSGVGELPERDRAGFLEAWRGAVTRADRNGLTDALRRRLAALAAETDQGDDHEDDTDDEEPVTPEPSPEIEEEEPVAPEPDDIDAQLAAAAKATGRGRRARARE